MVPVIVTGGIPSFESICAPKRYSAFSKDPIGRFERLSSPLSMLVPFAKDAIAAAILILVPEFATSIFAAFISRVPFISNLLSLFSMRAPNFSHADMVARVSFERSGLYIVLLPSARDARNIAL